MLHSYLGHAHVIEKDVACSVFTSKTRRVMFIRLVTIFAASSSIQVKILIQASVIRTVLST